MRKCFTCEGNYQCGPHIYDGKKVHYYNFAVCKTCWDANWDGWSSAYEQKIIAHLKKENITLPERNNKGWFPRDL